MKDDDGIKFTSITAQDNPHSYLTYHHEKKISEHQAKSWFGPIGDQTSKSSQSKSPPYLPWQQDLVAKTNVLRQNHCEDWCVAPTISTIFIFLLLFPPSDEEEEHRYLPKQEIWGKEFLSRGVDFFQGSALFMDEDIRSSPIQILNHPRKVGSLSTIYGISNQPDINRLCHTISFIKLSAVRQRWCVQSNSQRHIDCSPMKYK